MAAELYDSVRPGFAEAAIDWVLPKAAGRVLDLAAGTGKLTDSLVARGLDVVAVDPAPNMLAVLRRRWPAVDARVGCAERIPLPDASVGTVLVGAAFHWFVRPEAEREIARVLRPGGRLGLLGNPYDPDSWVAEVFEDALHSFGVQREGFSRKETIPDARWFGPSERARFAHIQPLRADQIADLLASRSYVIAMPEAERAALLDRVRRAVARHVDPAAPVVEVRYHTEAIRTDQRLRSNTSRSPINVNSGS
ncbi:MAG TPA: methyltransferase domain-containing protein [Jatrophihabitantaceae bacterium]|nr:methyltransferase domain-containing protein [Jatrophihabitantaceae bacterium]